MRTLRRRLFGRVVRKRLAASIALLAYLAVSSGLPMPVPAAQKDRSRPYPCMDDPWGCTSPEECWRHCQTYTAEERWAWAEEHHVQPPDYAELPAPEAERTDPARPAAGGAVMGEVHHHPHSHAPHGSGLHGRGGASAPHSITPSNLWAGADATPAPSPITWRPTVVLVGRLTDHDQSASQLSQAPPSPPPR